MVSHLHSDCCVIDFLAVYSNEKKYIVKELAAYRLNTCQVWFFQLPVDIPCFKVVETNKWLERKFHGIPLDYGHVPYESLTEILESIVLETTFVFCKGQEKCSFLKKILPDEFIIDLNSFNCPKHFEPSLTCLFHYDKYDKECAFRNCLSNAKWLTNFICFERSRYRFIDKYFSNVPISSIKEDFHQFLPFQREETPEKRLQQVSQGGGDLLPRFWSYVIEYQSSIQ